MYISTDINFLTVAVIKIRSVGAYFIILQHIRRLYYAMFVDLTLKFMAQFNKQFQDFSKILRQLSWG